MSKLLVMRYSIEELESGLVGAQALSNVISTADLKAHLRVTHSDEDTMIEAMRTAAIKHVESMTNTRIGQRACYIRYDEAYSELEIPIGPIESLSGVQYSNAGDDPNQTLTEGTHYYKDIQRNPARIKFISIPSVYNYNYYAIKVTAIIGYDAASTPDPIVHAIKLLVAHMYELRQPEISGTITTKLKLGLEALLNPYRIISFR